MPFTKEQRLKGLKKQLRNLGYDVTRKGGGSAPAPADDHDDDEDIHPGDRGYRTIMALRARDEGW